MLAMKHPVCRALDEQDYRGVRAFCLDSVST